MNIITFKVNFKTAEYGELKDITDIVQEKILETDFKEGNVLIFAQGSTTALTTLEFESGLIKDFKDLLEKIAPPDFDYHHNRKWNDGNGHSHLVSALFKTNLTVPFLNRKLLLGTWQQIVFIECDNRSRQRELIVQVTGH